MECYTGGTSDYRWCDAHGRLLDDCRKIFGADCPSCAALRTEVDRLKELWDLEHTRYKSISSASNRLAEINAALRARVKELEQEALINKEEWRIQAETALKRLGRIKQLEEVVEKLENELAVYKDVYGG